MSRINSIPKLIAALNQLVVGISDYTAYAEKDGVPLPVYITLGEHDNDYVVSPDMYCSIFNAVNAANYEKINEVLVAARRLLVVEGRIIPNAAREMAASGFRIHAVNHIEGSRVISIITAKGLLGFSGGDAYEKVNNCAYVGKSKVIRQFAENERKLAKYNVWWRRALRALNPFKV